MTNRLWLWITVALLAAGMALTALTPMDRASTFAAVSEAWADVFQDAGQGLGRVTRGDTRQEIELGQRIATQVEAGAHMPADLSTYVSAVGQKLVRHARRQDLRWRFRVIDSPAINAFALPGGSVYVYRGLFDKLHDESQLAALLGHEIAHADLYHCIDRFRLNGIAAFSYAQNQEMDADEYGLALALKAGYDPSGATSLMTLLDELHPAPAPRTPRSPLGEVTGATGQALSDFFRSHPRTPERRSRLRAAVEREIRWSRDAGMMCIGEENLRQRKPCPDLAGAGPNH